MQIRLLDEVAIFVTMFHGSLLVPPKQYGTTVTPLWIDGDAILLGLIHCDLADMDAVACK